MGHRVTIVDRVETLEPVGAGIGMQPIGLTVLRRLGLLAPVLRHGARVDQLHGVTPTGRDVLNLKYATLDPRLFGVGLHRGVLLGELVSAMLRKAPPGGTVAGVDGSDSPGPGCIDLRTGVDVADVDVRSDGTAALRDTSGVVHGPFDLVVVADGSKSVLREPLPWKSHRARYPFGCAWAILPDHEREFCDSGKLSQVYDSARIMLGFLPTGYERAAAVGEHDAPDSPSPSAPKTVSVFWSLPRADMPAFRQQPVQAWKDAVLKLQPRAEALLSHVTSHDDVALATYSDVSMPTFGKGPVVALGDCAHAMSPQVRASPRHTRSVRQCEPVRLPPLPRASGMQRACRWCVRHSLDKARMSL